MPRDAERDQHLCADQQGFSLHAAVRCDADERQRLEQLCRYITRPALANERVQINLLKVRQHLRDAGNTIVVIENNLVVIKTADWIHRHGAGGGRVVAQGTPEAVAANPESHTGVHLNRVL